MKWNGHFSFKKSKIIFPSDAPAKNNVKRLAESTPSDRMPVIYTQKAASQGWEGVVEREMVAKCSSEIKTLPVEVRRI